MRNTMYHLDLFTEIISRKKLELTPNGIKPSLYTIEEALQVSFSISEPTNIH